MSISSVESDEPDIRRYILGHYEITLSLFSLEIKNKSIQPYDYRLPILFNQHVPHYEHDHIELIEHGENIFHLRTSHHKLIAKRYAADGNESERVHIKLYALIDDGGGDELLATDYNATVRVFNALRAIGRGEEVDADQVPAASQGYGAGAGAAAIAFPDDPFPAAGGRRRKNTRGNRRQQTKRKSRKQRRN